MEMEIHLLQVKEDLEAVEEMVHREDLEMYLQFHLHKVTAADLLVVQEDLTIQEQEAAVLAVVDHLFQAHLNQEDLVEEVHQIQLQVHQ